MKVGTGQVGHSQPGLGTNRPSCELHFVRNNRIDKHYWGHLKGNWAGKDKMRTFPNFLKKAKQRQQCPGETGAGMECCPSCSLLSNIV